MGEVWFSTLGYGEDWSDWVQLRTWDRCSKIFSKSRYDDALTICKRPLKYDGEFVIIYYQF
jgi:hypothetical protein